MSTNTHLPPFVFEGLSSTLKPGNAAMSGTLKTALSALHHLDDAGCTVLDLDIRGATPVLRVDRPPQFVRGAIRVSRPRGSWHRVLLRVASYHGAQIEWEQIERRRTVPAEWPA